MLRITPERFRAITCAARSEHRNAPFRFTSSRWSHQASSASSTCRAAWISPALFTSTSMVPKRASTASNMASTCALSETSAAMAIAPGIPAATSSARSRERSLTATLAPSRPKRSATARPMPWPAPVTSTPWPSNRKPPSVRRRCFRTRPPHRNLRRGRQRARVNLRGHRFVLIVLIVLAVNVHVIARQAAADQQRRQNPDPFQRPAVPGVLARYRRRRGLHHRERRARPEPQLEVPRHQIEMRLPAHLAPEEKYRHNGDQKLRRIGEAEDWHGARSRLRSRLLFGTHRHILLSR